MAGAVPDLYILRHGQTEWNAAGRMQGALDSPLTDLGRAQAEAQGRILAREGLLHLPAFVSPQGRTLATAAIALGAASSSARADPRLREMSLGAWDGLTGAEIAAGWPEVTADFDPWSVYGRAPQGEPLDAVHDRALAFLAELPGPAIVVTHGITSRFLRVAALGLSPAEWLDLPGGQGMVYRVRQGRHDILED